MFESQINPIWRRTRNPQELYIRQHNTWTTYGSLFESFKGV
jgi:hypothetical protein